VTLVPTPYFRTLALQRYEKMLAPKMLVPPERVPALLLAASLRHPLRAAHCHHYWGSGTRQ
jgi:hypothetical protein